MPPIPQDPKLLKKLKISMLEYALCIIVIRYSNTIRGNTRWCDKSKRFIAELLNISNRNIYRIINNLKQRKLIHSKNELLKVSARIRNEDRRDWEKWRYFK